MVKFNLRSSLPSRFQGTDVRWNGLLAAMFYGVTSSTMAFLNKAVLSAFSFNYPFFLLAAQMTVTIVAVEILTRRSIVTVPPYTLRDGLGFIWPSVFHGMHGILSLYALHGLNIPMYGALKRCTPLITLILAVVVLKKNRPSLLLVTSIIIITSGCFIAALGDVTYDPAAYILALLSVMAQGLYLTLVQYYAEAANMSSIRILQINSYNSFLPFIILSILVGEPKGVVSAPYWNDKMFIFVLVSLVLVGSVFNYSLFLCTAVNSALTTSLVGVAKSVVQTGIGFFAFGGVAFNPLNVSGIVMNTTGGFLYVYAKYLEKKSASVLLPKTSTDQNLNLISEDEKPIVTHRYSLTGITIT